MKLRIPFHHDRVPLNVKVAVLLTGSVIFSLSLAGTVVYQAMRVTTYAHYADALAQIASVSTVVFETEQLQAAVERGEGGKKARAALQADLARLWRQNRFDRSGRQGRLTVVQLDLVKGEMTPLAWLGEKPHFSGEAPPQVWETAARGVAMSQGIEALENDWMKAWAPLGIAQKGRTPILLQAEYSSSVVNYQLIQNLGVIILACLLGLLVALLGAVLIGYQITKPLRAFADVMTLMEDTDNFNIRIDLHPHDREMKIVEQTFIRLMKKVAESRSKVENSYLSTLQALVTALDIRDNESSGHSLRVMRYAGLVADRLHLGAEKKDEIERGALLHDIGKIGVPDAILRKNGQLTEKEWIEMKKHPQIGRTLLEGIDFLESAIPVVHCHHERWDGEGYPRGLRGEEIPMAARIFMVVDALDTITSERYYKRASSFEAARKEIERSAGTHFDPSVVDAFLTIPVKTLRRIRSEATPRINQNLITFKSSSKSEVA